MDVEIAVSAHTDIGSVRHVNEDSFLARSPTYLVADGMGGHARGDRASREAIEVFGERFADGSPATAAGVLEAVEDANAAVRALSGEEDSGVAVAGTTLAGVVLVTSDTGQNWMVVNIGDSRVYRWESGRLEQVSVDHSAIQELLDSGAIDLRQAESHPERNVITRALGPDAHPDVDIWLFPVSGRQAFLICSDGLPKELDDGRIASIMAASDGPDAARDLVAAAVAAGGRDNVTVVVVESMAGLGSQMLDDTQDRNGIEPLLEETRPRG